MNNEVIHKILDNRIAMIFVMLAAAAGAIISIAGGFRVVYQVITWLGT